MLNQFPVAILFASSSSLVETAVPLTTIVLKCHTRARGNSNKRTMQPHSKVLTRARLRSEKVPFSSHTPIHNGRGTDCASLQEILRLVALVSLHACFIFKTLTKGNTGGGTHLEGACWSRLNYRPLHGAQPMRDLVKPILLKTQDLQRPSMQTLRVKTPLQSTEET